MFGRRASPRSGTRRAESGHRSHVVRPTTRPPAPIAKSTSVVEGLSDTMRVRGAPMRVVSPKSSTSMAAVVAAEPASRVGVHATTPAERPSDAVAATRTIREKESAGICSEWRKPATPEADLLSPDATSPPPRV